MRFGYVIELVVCGLVAWAVWNTAGEWTSEKVPVPAFKWAAHTKFSQTDLTNTPTSSCTGPPVTGAVSSGVTGACQYLNNRPGCCTASPQVGPAIGAFLGSQCSDSTCRKYFTGYWCTFSCAPPGALCQADLSAFATACANCPLLVSGGWAPDSSNTNSSANCTALILPPDATAVPTVTAFTVSPAADTVTFNYATTTTQTWNFTVTVQSDAPPTANLSFSNNGVAYFQTLLVDFVANPNTVPQTWTINVPVCLGIYTVPAGQTIVSVYAINSVGNSETKNPTGLSTLTIVLQGNPSASLTAADPCNAAVSGCPAAQGSAPTAARSLALPATTNNVQNLGCSCGSSCGLQGQGSTIVTVTLLTLSSLETKLTGMILQLVNLAIGDGATQLTFSSSSLSVSGAFNLNKPFFKLAGDSTSALTMAQGSSLTIAAGSRLVCQVKLQLAIVAVIIGAIVSEASLQTNSGGGLNINAGASVTAQSSTIDAASPILSMASGSTCTGAGTLTVAGGLANIVGSDQNCAMSVSTYSSKASTTGKMQVQRYTAPAGATKLQWCMSKIATTTTIASTAQLVVQTTCVYATPVTINGVSTDVTSWVSGVTNNVVVNAGGYLTFDQITTSSKVLNIEGQLQMATAAVTEALITGTASFPSGGAQIVLARFDKTGWATGGVDCSTPAPNRLVEGCPTGRTCALLIRQDGSTGYCQLYLNVTAATASTTSSSTFLYTSASLYSLVLGRDCAVFSNEEFIDIMSRLGGVDPYQVVVVSTSCSSMTVNFRCTSATSISAADAVCSTLRSTAQTAGSDLNKALNVANAGKGFDRMSDDALYALFVLTLVPVFCTCAFIWWYKAKQKEADDQYLQDTQTFTQQARPAPPQQPAGPYYPPPAYPVAQPVAYPQ